jgi:branched-subunit amino acid aminotransferase/4-amino-4-deoxychorismate lyase
MSAAEIPFLCYAMFNAAVLAIDDLKVSPLGSGFMAGEGMFETIRVQNSRPVFFESHQARLASSLRSLNDAPFSSRGELHTRCMRVIAANSLVNGSIKIVLFKEAAGWSELILARGPSYTPECYEKGFRLKTFPGDLRVEPLNGFKSLNYLRNLYAKRTAIDEGFDEALFINPADQVLEGAGTNIFIVKDCVISTPSLDAGILPGVMRGIVLRKLAQGVREREVSRAELLEADEVFVTNVLVGIMPVSAVDETTYDLVANVITRSVSGALVQLGDG